MRALVALLVIAALLAGAGVAADAWLTRSAEEQASRRLSAELGAPASVDLRGWPVSLRLLGGHVPEVAVAATDVPVEGSPAQLARFEATVTDVRVRFADLRGSGALPVEGGPGVFEVQLDEANVNRVVDVPGGVRLRDGIASVEVAGQAVDVVPVVDGPRIVLRPVTEVPGAQPIPVPLPDLPAEVLVERVSVTPGWLVVGGRVLRLAR